MRVLIASGFPEHQNKNISIVGDLAEGFRAILEEGDVHCFPFLGLEAQILYFEPRMMVLVGSALPTIAVYREIANACRFTKTILVFWTLEDPYEFDVNYKFAEIADLVFSNDAWACEFYDRDRVFHLPTAASESRLRSLHGYEERWLDFFFCGVGFSNRRTLISDAISILKKRRSLILGEGWPEIPGGVVFNRRLTDAELTAHYGASRCVLNIGRDFNFANNRRSLCPVTPGPRTFEAAMTGTVQLYHRPTRFLKDYFALDDEMVTFDTLDELESNLDRLLADPVSARKIAEAAQSRALTEHTYKIRARSILTCAGLM